MNDSIWFENAREWRREYNRTQQEQAAFLGVSKAYISALETGSRGRPSAIFVDQVCVWLGLIWDDAEDLKGLPVCRTRSQQSMFEARRQMRYISQIFWRKISASYHRKIAAI